MKSILLSLVAHAVGDPIIFTGQTAKIAGTGIRKAGEYIEHGGVAIEAKGREVKAGFQGRAVEAAVDEEIARHEKAAQAAQVRLAAHMSEINILELALAQARAKLAQTMDGGAMFQAPACSQVPVAVPA